MTMRSWVRNLFTRPSNRVIPSVANRRRPSPSKAVAVHRAFRSTLEVGRLEERLTPSLMPMGSEFRANTYITNQQHDPVVAMDSGGDFVVVWSSDGQDGSMDGIYCQQYNSAGATQGSEFPVNTYTTAGQVKPAVAMNAAGNFVVVWSSFNQGGPTFGSEIYARRYVAGGIALDPIEFHVNVTTGGDQTFPAVAMDDNGNFVVAWTSPDGNSQGIYARRFNAAGIALDAIEFRVNVVTTGAQADPAVAIDSVGNFVVTWDNTQDGSGRGIYASRYGATGVALNSEFRVNTYTTGDQRNSSVSRQATGEFVVSWYSDGQDGDQGGIYAQRYNAAGGPLGGEFRVNTITTGSQSFPSVAVGANGDFVISWISASDGDSTGIDAQAFNAAGVAQGGEIQVNTYTTQSQELPIVAA